MKTFYLKEKFWSWTDDFYVTDDRGQACYQVKGSFFKWAKEFTLLDLANRPVARVKNHLLSFLPRFTIELANGQRFLLEKKLSWWRARYEVAGLGLKVKGDLLAMNFTLTKYGQEIAKVKQEWFKMTHSYRVKVHDDQYSSLVLALVIAIEYVKDSQISRKA
ncbi:LURP-one-related/scramblase family protein [Streptococcus cuniculipharyngis]|uniref:Tubby C 2 family protein n=1 Tax=Streptococcus cuniculipharyngis TaxID=1562651 RepID=A0A5C5SDX0_9STRE|nr:LURP-one-related family protein [Streptococcus cuniculipharyngis]TWS99004.1 hypothetical protein FRX57_02030 [Streptococcus cuniculipharyngis]